MDIYGRTVTKSTADDMDTYTVTDSNGNSFTISVDAGTPEDAVRSTIDAMAPVS